MHVFCVYTCTIGEPWNSSVSIQQTDAQSPSSNAVLELMNTTVWRPGHWSRAGHVTGLKTVQSSRISSRLSHGATFNWPGVSCHRTVVSRTLYSIHSLTPFSPLFHDIWPQRYCKNIELLRTAIQTNKRYITVCTVHALTSLYCNILRHN